MILVLSKNTDLVQNIQKFLELEGFEVEIADSVQNTLVRLYQENVYECLMVDFTIDKENIFSIIKTIKENTVAQRVPLLCIIPKDRLADQLIAFEMGVDDFIIHPFNVFEIQLKMRSLQRIIQLQKSLREKENQIESYRNLNRIVGTLNHHINNALTPLFSLAQTCNPDNPGEVQQLIQLIEHTTLFISRVLKALRNLIQQGELKVVQEGVYRDIMFDIEEELRRLMQESQRSVAKV